MLKAVFLDRDGVINRTIIRDGRPFAPLSLDQFEILPDVEKALLLLRQAGLLLIVVTNQPDVGHGLVPCEVVEAMHARLRELLPIDDIEVCYSTQAEQSYRRKPQPGMLLEAAAAWKIDLKQSFMVGDRWSDVEAGRAAGCRTIWIQRHYQEQQAVRYDFVALSLLEASHTILDQITSDRLFTRYDQGLEP